MEGLRRVEERRSRDIRWRVTGLLDGVLGVFFGGEGEGKNQVVRDYEWDLLIVGCSLLGYRMVVW